MSICSPERPLVPSTASYRLASNWDICVWSSSPRDQGRIGVLFHSLFG